MLIRQVQNAQLTGNLLCLSAALQRWMNVMTPEASVGTLTVLFPWLSGV